MPKKKTRRQHYIPTANRIIADARLYPSSRRVLLAMLAHRGRKNHVRLTQMRLAKLAHCSRSTVCHAVAQLQELGYVQVCKRYRYSDREARLVRAANVYTLCNVGLEDGYTLVPYALIGAEITHATFAVLLHGYCYSGRKGRCYASLRHLAKASDLSKSTVIRALRQLCRLQMVIRLRCVKVNRSFSCNSYYPTAMVWAQNPGPKIFADRGGSIFGQPLDIKKITEAYIERGEKYGVGQFGVLHNDCSDMEEIQPYFFDGTGVKVFVTEEQFF